MTIFPEFSKTELLTIDMKILSMLGFWPKNLVNRRSVFFVISCFCLEIIPMLLFIIKNFADIQKVFMCLHEFISLIVLMIKIVIFLFKKDEIIDLIENLRKEWKIAYDDENLQWKQNSALQERLIFKYTKLLYSFIFFSALIYFIVPILSFFIFFDYQKIQNWPFPVQVYYGFEYQQQPFLYVLLLIPTIVLMLSIILIFYGIDYLYINLLVYCCNYFRYVQCKIKHLNDLLLISKVNNQVLKKEIVGIVVAHNKSIRFSKQLEDVSNILIMVLYSVNTILLCFLFFEFNILSKDLLNLFKVLVFLGVVQILLFLFSYFGQTLMNESNVISNLIYELPWYEFEDHKVARGLTLSIMRSQKACTITAGKFYPVNFESYLAAIRTAYSFCTVLKEIM